MNLANWTNELPINMKYDLMYTCVHCRLIRSKRLKIDIEGIINVYDVMYDCITNDKLPFVNGNAIIKVHDWEHSELQPWIIAPLITASQILAYYHPNKSVRDAWMDFCVKYANMFHLRMMTKEELIDEYYRS